MISAQQTGECRGLKLSLTTYVVVFALKLTAYLVTGVIAILAEALHTLSDLLIAGFMVLVHHRPRKEVDEVHMFGYGRAQKAAALVGATLLVSFMSYMVYQAAIPKLFGPEPPTYQYLPLAVGVLGASMLLTTVPLVGLIWQAPRGTPAVAQLVELVGDELCLVVALVATLVVMYGQPLADPIAAIAVGTIIAVNAIQLVAKNLGLLVARSPGPDFLAMVEQLGRSVEGVMGVRDLRAEYIGSETIRAAMCIEVLPGSSVAEAERLAEQVRQRVQRETGCRACVIHVDVAEPSKIQPSPAGAGGAGEQRSSAL